MEKLILAIDTSCDETAAAVVQGRKVRSSVIYSQILMHKEWGGVVPSIAKRAHEERIDWVIQEAMKKAVVQHDQLDAIAVTYGPGLAIALEVGIRHAVELAQKWGKPLVSVNHMEGHLYSPFVQNSKGNPSRTFDFPYLGLLISGGHTELVLFKDHLQYEILGETVDDAAGEALDKAARMLGFGYPGGPVIERLAVTVDNTDKYVFPRPMMKSGDLNFSFSGLKTALLYKVRKMSDEEKQQEIAYLASSFQEAVFKTVVKKTEKAMVETGIHHLLVGGGVAVNKHLRTMMRALAKKHGGYVHFPALKYLNYDNAAMIGVVGAIRAEKGLCIENTEKLDRVPRLSLLQSSI